MECSEGVRWNKVRGKDGIWLRGLDGMRLEGRIEYGEGVGWNKVSG